MRAFHSWSALLLALAGAIQVAAWVYERWVRPWLWRRWTTRNLTEEDN